MATIIFKTQICSCLSLPFKLLVALSSIKAKDLSVATGLHVVGFLSPWPCFLVGPPSHPASSYVNRVLPVPCLCQAALFASSTLLHLAYLSR